MIEPNQRVTIADKPLHGKQANLIDGQVISIKGSSALVQVDHEDMPREFSLDVLKSSEEVFGAERTSPFDNQVIDALPRR